MFALLFTKLMSLPFAATACSSIKDVGGGTFFGLPHWWEYIPNVKVDEVGKCVPDYNFPGDIWAIALAIVDMLLRVAGLVAIVAIILAGVGYITASGNPEKTVAARQRIYNALIGLAIVFLASGVVAFIGNKLGG